MSELRIGGPNCHLIFGYAETKIPGVVALGDGKETSTSCICIGWPHTEYIKAGFAALKLKLAEAEKCVEAAREVLRVANLEAFGSGTTYVLPPEYNALQLAILALDEMGRGA